MQTQTSHMVSSNTFTRTLSARRFGGMAGWRLQRGSLPVQGRPACISALPSCALAVSPILSKQGPWVVPCKPKHGCETHRQRFRFPQGRRQLQCKALGLPEAVDATLRNIISISAVVGISYAVLLAAVSEPPTPPSPPPGPASRALPPGSTPLPAARGGSSRNEDDNFVWGLMGFISCLPLFNWLAWVLAAISDEDRAALYGIYAAVYGTPLLLRGLDWQDPWVLFMLVLCVVHVQAERIAQTEPEVLRGIRPVGALGAVLRGVVGGTGSLLSGLGGVLAEDSRRLVRRPGGRNRDVGDGGAGGGGHAQLGPGEEQLRLDLDLDLGRDPDLVVRGRPREPVLDPRRDPARDPELEDFSKKELREFDEELRRAEQRRQGGPGARPGSGPGVGGGSGSGSGGQGS